MFQGDAHIHSPPRLVLYAIGAVFAFSIVLALTLSHVDFIARISDLWRTDKYKYSIDLASIAGLLYIALGAAVIYLANRFVSIQWNATSVAAVMYVVLVMPGVLFASHEVSNGDNARILLGAAFFAFSIGVLIVSVITTKLQEANVGKGGGFSGRFHIDVLPRWCAEILIMCGLLLLAVSISQKVSGAYGFQNLMMFFSEGYDQETFGSLAEDRASRYSHGRSYLGILADYSIIALMPIIGLALILHSSVQKKRFNTCKWFGILFITAPLLIAFGSGHRLYIGRIALFLLIGTLMIRGVNMKMLTAIMAVLLLILMLGTIVLGRMVGGDGSNLDIAVIALNRLVERAFMTKGVITTEVFAYFPAYEQFLGGESIFRRVMGTLGTGPTLAEKMHMHLFGFPGTAGPQAFGEAYANFGSYGMLLTAFMYGILLQIITFALSARQTMSAFNIAIVAYLTFAFGYIGYSDMFAPRVAGAHIVIMFWCLISVMATVLARVEGRVFGNAVAPSVH